MSDMEGTTIMGRDYCPHCSEPLDAATSFEDDTSVPMPGDVSVCFNCTEFLVYETDMSLAVLTQRAYYELDEDTQKILLSARRAIQELKNKNNE